jgi:hypothetical protein
LSKKFIERRVRFTIDVCDERVVVILVKSTKEVADQFVLVKGLAHCS